MLAWQDPAGRMLEATRVLLGQGGLRAIGRMVRTSPDAEPLTAEYRLFVNEAGLLSRVTVASVTAARERQVTVNHTEDGFWIIDTGSGGSRSEFGGALDVDLQFSAMFNTLPIRRLRLHQQAGEHEVPVVFIGLPELTVELVSQSYRTVSLSDPERPVVGFTWDDFTAEIVVDRDGFVIDYPAVARRLPDFGVGERAAG